MKNQSHANLLIRSSLALTLSAVLWAPLQAQSTMPMKDKPMMDGKTAGQVQTVEPAKGMMMEGKMKEHCQEMQEQKQKMMAEMKAQDTALTAQVASMNNAPKDKKPDLLTAIVTRMAEERTAMNDRKAMMDEKMMRHMTEHMQMGEKSMSQCPMMKGMDEKPMGAHKKH